MQQGKARSQGKGAMKKGSEGEGVKDMVMVQIDIQFLQLLTMLVILKAKEIQYKAKDSLYYNSLNTNVLHGGHSETLYSAIRPYCPERNASYQCLPPRE